MIETNRLILRAFIEDDAEDMLEYLSTPQVNCFIDMQLHSLEESRKEAIRRSNHDREYYFAICLKSNGKVIGEIFSHPEEDNETFSPCWMIHPDYQGKGYAYEATYAYFDYLFKYKNARRIYIYTEDYNYACQNLCAKLGMRQEGLFMEFVSFVRHSDGTPKYENTYQYAILKKEWK